MGALRFVVHYPTGEPIRPGQRVRTAARLRPERYANQGGTVVGISRERFAGGGVYAEVGVTFSERRSSAAWFLPGELRLGG